jgi:hypothetical protein
MRAKFAFIGRRLTRPREGSDAKWELDIGSGGREKWG